ncbi:uncharacterized protein LOC120104031 [Phoenix dactylifera]|uniref:Uncharacterized protein LOC120104031 n=1 Tax=Phoenix dactylifera TaxID=42345 RepID=A0A8B8ZIV1_PHODC|nr:uncharacterized protein LOC120104031 [Phoenix dactylifera]
MPDSPMENNNKLVMTSLEPSPGLGVIGILRKASTISLRNGRLTVSLILLMLLPFLLSLGFHLALDTIKADLSSKISLLPKDLNSPEAQKIVKEISEDMRKLLGVTLVFALAGSLISLFSLTTTVSSSAMLYVGKHFTLKDLFQRVKITWTGPLITGFFIALISIAYFLATLLLIGVVTILARDGVLFNVLVALIVLLAIIFC